MISLIGYVLQNSSYETVYTFLRKFTDTWISGGEAAPVRLSAYFHCNWTWQHTSILSIHVAKGFQLRTRSSCNKVWKQNRYLRHSESSSQSVPAHTHNFSIKLSFLFGSTFEDEADRSKQTEVQSRRYSRICLLFLLFFWLSNGVHSPFPAYFHLDKYVEKCLAKFWMSCLSLQEFDALLFGELGENFLAAVFVFLGPTYVAKFFKAGWTFWGSTS